MTILRLGCQLDFLQRTELRARVKDSARTTVVIHILRSDCSVPCCLETEIYRIVYLCKGRFNRYVCVSSSSYRNCIRSVWRVSVRHIYYIVIYQPLLNPIPHIRLCRRCQLCFFRNIPDTAILAHHFVGMIFIDVRQCYLTIAIDLSIIGHLNNIIFDFIGLAVVANNKVLRINSIIRLIGYRNRIYTSCCIFLFPITKNGNLTLNQFGILLSHSALRLTLDLLRVFIHLRTNRHRLPIHGNDLSRRNNIVRLTRLTLSLSSRTRISIARRNGISASLRRGKQPCIGNLVSNVLTIPRNRIGDSHRRCINARRIASVKQRRRQRLSLPIRHVLAAHHQLLLAGGDHVDGNDLRLRFLKYITAAVNCRHSVYAGSSRIPGNFCLSIFNFYILRKATVAGRVDNLEGDASGRNLVIPCVGICYVHCKFNSIASLLFLDCGCRWVCAFRGENRKARNVNQCVIINFQLLYFFHICNVLL